jgi:hypothetical protein
MNYLNHYLNERSSEVLNLKKGKWEKIDIKKLTKFDIERLEPEFYELIQTAYAPIGGHVNFKSPKDIFADKEIDFWQGIDLDNEPDLDVIVFGKKTKYGIKLTGVGHDGAKESKKEYLEAKAKDLSKTGFFNEVSGKIAEIMLEKYRISAVTNKEDIEKVLGKEIEFLGDHPDGVTVGYGWYSRLLGGHQHIKILLGKPKGI